MKISDEQRNAAALYWTQILIGHLSPKALVTSKKIVAPFMATIEYVKKENTLMSLNQQNPTWARRFMSSLDALLINADTDLVLKLEYCPQDLLKQAAEMAEIPEKLFPSGKLTMTFDTKDNLLVEDEVINAQDFLNQNIEEVRVSLSNRARL
ncbi:hypothetical protein J2N86_09820 [Legionella lytica]|uniref:Uncharacterized protein n=1 Tax=Legionella lytica TaxID=96232 RepID=A0ABY4Y5V0_9GAMM|nr:hypothetical protein [Legionella lytica]USQ12999.1 hypothetical protein J2N86_09820 [Legionella lytica]